MAPGKLLLFAGTSEGRELFARALNCGIDAEAAVATDYGRSQLQELGGKIHTGRLDEGQIAAMLAGGTYRLVVDATHPYADKATANIAAACAVRRVPYLRLVRPEQPGGEVINCTDMAAAVDYLRDTDGGILCTVGSKQLEQLCQLPDYRKRVYARILPLEENLSACRALGFAGAHILCMQGPFSAELNAALLRQYSCRYLLTKSSGAAGGFAQKLQGAKMAGAQVVVIDRPTSEQGLSLTEVWRRIAAIWQLPEECEVSAAVRRRYFPLFVQTANKRVLVVGGGQVATRRVQSLLHFDWQQVTVVAPQVSKHLRDLAGQGAICWRKRCFAEPDVGQSDVVLAATDSSEVNRWVVNCAQDRGIFANNASDRHQCDFYFPALALGETQTAALVGRGGDHRQVARTAAKIREVLRHEDNGSE